MYFYVDKKAKGMKKCVIKCQIKYEDYNDCLENNEKVLRSNQSFKSEAHIFSLRKLVTLHRMEMMIQDHKRLMQWYHIHMTQVLEECAKQNSVYI